MFFLQIVHCDYDFSSVYGLSININNSSLIFMFLNLEYPKPDMASAGYDANCKDGGLFIYFKTEHVLT